MKQIPATFKILGHTVNVVLRPDLADTHEALGLCHPDRLLIELQASGPDTKPSVAMQTFLHEWVHMMFHMIGEPELYDNERVVDLAAQCLYQLLVTKRGRAVLGKALGDSQPVRDSRTAKLSSSMSRSRSTACPTRGRRR